MDTEKEVVVDQLPENLLVQVGGGNEDDSQGTAVCPKCHRTVPVSQIGTHINSCGLLVRMG